MTYKEWDDVPIEEKNKVLRTLGQIAAGQRKIADLKMQRFRDQLIEAELPKSRKHRSFSKSIDRKFFPGYISKWKARDRQKIQDLADEIFFFVTSKIESDDGLGYYYGKFYDLFPEVCQYGFDYYFAGSMTAGPGHHSIYLAFELRLNELEDLEAQK